MNKYLVLLMVLSISTINLYSQNKTLKGRVISDFFETMPGVAIMINDSVKVGRTDLDGFFKIEIPNSINKITFRFVGVDPTSIEVIDECDKIEVVMMMTGTYDFMTLKRAERKRKKRFNKIPEIHKQAFEKGIFQTKDACYNRTFEPYYINKN